MSKVAPHCRRTRPRAPEPDPILRPGCPLTCVILGFWKRPREGGEGESGQLLPCWWAERTWGSALQACEGQGAGSVRSRVGCGDPSLPGMDWSSLGAVPSLLPLGPTSGSETVTLPSEPRPLRLLCSWPLGWPWLLPTHSRAPSHRPQLLSAWHCWHAAWGRRGTWGATWCPGPLETP